MSTWGKLEKVNCGNTNVTLVVCPGLAGSHPSKVQRITEMEMSVVATRSIVHAPYLTFSLILIMERNKGPFKNYVTFWYFFITPVPCHTSSHLEKYATPTSNPTTTMSYIFYLENFEVQAKAELVIILNHIWQKSLTILTAT